MSISGISNSSNTQQVSWASLYSSSATQKTDGPPPPPRDGGGGLVDAIKQALAQIGAAGSSSDGTTDGSTSATDSSTAATDSTSATDPAQALSAFMQQLMQALHAQGSAQANGGQDSDGDHDGSKPPPASGGAGGRHARIEADLEGLLKQVTASDSSTTADAGSTDSSSTDSSGTPSKLESSFQNLLSALGANTSGSDSQATLGNFLQALASKLEGAPPTGNVVNATA